MQNVYIFLPYITAARSAGIDMNEEITSLSPMYNDDDDDDDDDDMYCCGLGQLHQCPAGQFGVDCSGRCHCLAGNDVCRSQDGRCTQGHCSLGWTNPPYCQTGTSFCVILVCMIN